MTNSSQIKRITQNGGQELKLHCNKNQLKFAIFVVVFFLPFFCLLINFSCFLRKRIIQKKYFFENCLQQAHIASIDALFLENDRNHIRWLRTRAKILTWKEISTQETENENYRQEKMKITSSNKLLLSILTLIPFDTSENCCKQKKLMKLPIRCRLSVLNASCFDLHQTRKSFLNFQVILHEVASIIFVFLPFWREIRRLKTITAEVL